MRFTRLQNGTDQAINRLSRARLPHWYFGRCKSRSCGSPAEFHTARGGGFHQTVFLPPLHTERSLCVYLCVGGGADGSGTRRLSRYLAQVHSYIHSTARSRCREAEAKRHPLPRLCTRPREPGKHPRRIGDWSLSTYTDTLLHYYFLALYELP